MARRHHAGRRPVEPANQAMVTTPPSKPTDLWFFLGGIVGAVVLFLVPKTPPVVIFCCVLIFALLIHPVWNFWWIERSKFRQWAAMAITVTLILLLGIMVWPETRSGVVKHLRELAAAHDDIALSREVDRLSHNDDHSIEDVVMYFRGLVASRTAGNDPEPYLRQIRPESEFYYDAVMLRARTWAKSSDPTRAAAIADSLEQSRPVIYYRLRLVGLRPHNDIRILYNEFKERFDAYFDFENMKRGGRIKANQSQAYITADIFNIEGMVALFLYELIRSAHDECLNGFEAMYRQQYGLFTKNVPADRIKKSLSSIFVNPDVLDKVMRATENAPSPPRCVGIKQ